MHFAIRVVSGLVGFCGTKGTLMKKSLTRREAIERDEAIEEPARSGPRHSAVVPRLVGPRGDHPSTRRAPPDDVLYATLTLAHNELLERVEVAVDSDEDERAAAVRQLGIALLSHFYATKRSFLAALVHFEECFTLAQRTIDEQNQLVRLLYAGLTAISGSPGQADVLSELRESLCVHVERVEKELFALSHKCLPRLQTQNLQGRYNDLNTEYRLQLEDDFSPAQKPRVTLPAHRRLQG